MSVNIIKETARGLERISFEEEMLSKRQISLVGEVNSDSMHKLLCQLMYLESEAPGEEITLFINSSGGECESGLAVYDYINIMSSPIKTVCTGSAASMGAILFLSGKKREMLPHTRIMVHDPSYGNCNIAGAKPAEISILLDNLKEMQKTLCEIIMKHTGKSRTEVLAITKNDTYFNSGEAIKFGLATALYKM